MIIIKGNREFAIELDGSRLVVSEGTEKVYGTLYEGSTIIDFPQPNPQIANNGSALDGLSITLEQSNELNKIRSDFLEQRRKERDAKRNIPEKIQFSFGESFQIIVSAKDVKFDFIDKMNTIGSDWLRKKSKLTANRTSDDYMIYEIESSVVLTHLTAREERKAKDESEMEGKTAYSECWECGKIRIVGWIKNGKHERIPREFFNKIRKEFKAADGIKIKTVDPEDCGC